MSATSEKQLVTPLEDESNPEAENDVHVQQLGSALSSMTDDCSDSRTEAHETILAPAHSERHTSSWGLGQYLKAGVARFTKDAAYYHYGNYVADRATGERTFEQMPIYTRVGMHILYCGSVEAAMLKSSRAQELFIQESIKMGKSFDDASSRAKIPGFIKTFNLDTSDLLIQDPAGYPNFNAFFARALKPGARPVSEPGDEGVMVSAADCRLVVFPSLTLAQQFWIKGRRFSVPALLGPRCSDVAAAYAAGSISIFRLAPQDYHRWHTPLSGTVTRIVDLAGSLMTVNPMAINEDLDIYTENKRSVAFLATPHAKTPVLVIAVGAMLVGSIEWTVREGDVLTKGQEMGKFLYGGSTVLVLTPGDLPVQFDPDLLSNSEGQVIPANTVDPGEAQLSRGACETQVRVGERVGKLTPGSVQ
ncbi:Related to phosphatidylserine decarboxylase [Taphrina deformans PYCC 5710]|uniref:Related to phosphatidylserine decarboxylase n=1 Tax=Taphrina deformans (strain PYCC 5710 / ATCC 11124 / CBS 356.35 / IMI 108563 / JCM 9778 / NBRC 8474) TaxID=1097556 RepID=R4XCW3_TAPDE|nr:Related to phosphatidylserine decarboxylase [Taphrina deformans PYCC 5710]|eukprot:CCG83644.1 Related to phosphatidylserine decarboxylase [Taphrina deformans PYCC 5710]